LYLLCYNFNFWFSCRGDENYFTSPGSQNSIYITNEVVNGMTTLYQGLGLEGNGVISIVGAGGKTSLMFCLAREISRSGQTVLTTTTTKIMMPKKKQAAHVIITQSFQSLLDRAREDLNKTNHLCIAPARMPQQPEKIRGFEPEVIDRIKQSALFQWILVEADGAAQRPLKVPAEHEPVIPVSSKWVIGILGLKVLGKPLEPEWVNRHERFASIAGISQGQPVTVDAMVQAAIHPHGIFKGTPDGARKILFLNTAGNADRWTTGRKVAETIADGGANHNIHRLVIGSPLEGEAVCL
jgi:probable selenium-dependent hydroxylase accessory protein YqeC